MSDDMEMPTEVHGLDDAPFNIGSPDHERGAHPAVEWLRTLVTCGVLLGVVTVVLPMMPDHDMNGNPSQPQTTHVSAISPIDATDRNAIPTQPTSVIRRSGNLYNHT